MGISGLLPFLKKSSEPCHVRNLAHSTVAIDVYCWLHKGAFGCAQKLVQGQPTNGYILYVMKYLDLLLHHHIKPILVFDGRNLPSKSSTEKKRRENRTKYKKMAKEHLREGRLREATECFQRCVDITPEMARETIQACRERNIDCIVAPYEADAQLAFLNISGLAQYVITEDSDLTLFGCDKILFKLDIMGNGVLYQKSKLNLALGGKADCYNFDKFRYMGIMSGCDYLASLPKIGLGKAFKFWSLVSNPNIEQVLPKIPSYLNSSIEVSKEYIDGFIQANRTFLYQLVFDPKTRKLRPLNDYPEHEDLESLDLSYAGTMIDQETALQMAVGNLDINRMQKVCDYDPDSSRRGVDNPTFGKRANHDSIWNPNYDPKQTILPDDSNTAIASQDYLERDKVVKTAFGDFNISGENNRSKLNSSKNSSKTSSKRKIDDDPAEVDLFLQEESDADEAIISTQYVCSAKKRAKQESSQGAKEMKQEGKSPRKIYVSRYFSPKSKENRETLPQPDAELNLTNSKIFSRKPQVAATPATTSWFNDLDVESTAKGKFIYRTYNLEKDETKETDTAAINDAKNPMNRSRKMNKMSSFSPLKLLDSLEANTVPLKNTPGSLKAFKSPLLSSAGTASPSSSQDEGDAKNIAKDKCESEVKKLRRNPFAKKGAAENKKSCSDDDNEESGVSTEENDGEKSTIERKSEIEKVTEGNLTLSQLSAAYSIDSDSFRFTPKLVDSQDALWSSQTFSQNSTVSSDKEGAGDEDEGNSHFVTSDKKLAMGSSCGKTTFSSSQKTFSTTSETSSRYFGFSSQQDKKTPSSQKPFLSSSQPTKRGPKGMSGLVKRAPAGKGQKSILEMWGKR